MPKPRVGYLPGLHPSVLDQQAKTRDFYSKAFEGYVILWAEVDSSYCGVLARRNPPERWLLNYLYVVTINPNPFEHPLRLFEYAQQHLELKLDDLPSLLIGSYTAKFKQIIEAEIISAKNGPGRIDDLVVDDLFDALLDN